MCMLSTASSVLGTLKNDHSDMDLLSAVNDLSTII